MLIYISQKPKASLDNLNSVAEKSKKRKCQEAYSLKNNPSTSLAVMTHWKIVVRGEA